jgi:hypothetical protein
LTCLTISEETGGSRPPYGIAEWAGSISAERCLHVSILEQVPLSGREPALSDPAVGKHEEAMHFIALDDRQRSGAGLGDGSRGPRPLVPGISEDTVDEGKEAACAPIEDEQSAVAILHRCDFGSRPLTYRANGVILSEI